MEQKPSDMLYPGLDKIKVDRTDALFEAWESYLAYRRRPTPVRMASLYRTLNRCRMEIGVPPSDTADWIRKGSLFPRTWNSKAIQNASEGKLRLSFEEIELYLEALQFALPWKNPAISLEVRCLNAIARYEESKEARRNRARIKMLENSPEEQALALKREEQRIKQIREEEEEEEQLFKPGVPGVPARPGRRNVLALGNLGKRDRENIAAMERAFRREFPNGIGEL